MPTFLAFALIPIVLLANVKVSNDDGLRLKLTKKEQGQYLTILTKQARSIKDLLYGVKGNFSCGTQWVVHSRQHSSVLPARVANLITGFGLSLPLTKLGKDI